MLVSNHPQLAGGSHLPDITVITPIFVDGRIVFYVASRGHHADVGGIAPGSMPPLSKTLAEEGAAIVAFKLVDRGMFQEAGIAALLNAPGLLPGNFGTRNLSDNLSDLRAQVICTHPPFLSSSSPPRCSLTLYPLTRVQVAPPLAPLFVALYHLAPTPPLPHDSSPRVITPPVLQFHSSPLPRAAPSLLPHATTIHRWRPTARAQR